MQILLDADRRRIQNVRVLITMRSDFIGDCAYFHGLSEAVSATQYLVPNLTRSQLEEAIRNPVEKAGGDDRAGTGRTIAQRLRRRARSASGAAALPDAAVGPGGGGHPRWRRATSHTRRPMTTIGRMTDALSRHADEVFDQCPGKELAIEQAFRALSEVDREGRAIRRALRFDKLLAETGVSEADLRVGLDRFRAPNCSFLLPSLSASPTLGPGRADRHWARGTTRPWKKSQANPTRSTRKPAARRRAGWPKSRSTASAIIRLCRCSMGPRAANERLWTILGARTAGGALAADRRVGGSLWRQIRAGRETHRQRHRGEAAIETQSYADRCDRRRRSPRRSPARSGSPMKNRSSGKSPRRSCGRKSSTPAR